MFCLHQPTKTKYSCSVCKTKYPYSFWHHLQKTKTKKTPQELITKKRQLCCVYYQQQKTRRFVLFVISHRLTVVNCPVPWGHACSCSSQGNTWVGLLSPWRNSLREKNKFKRLYISSSSSNSADSLSLYLFIFRRTTIILTYGATG